MGRERILESCNNAEIVLIYKKGGNINLENHRYISLLSHLYRQSTNHKRFVAMSGPSRF